MSLLDRVNSRLNSGDQRGDVAPIVAAHQARTPQAYQSQSVLPDEAALAAFMKARQDDLNGLKLTGA